MKRAVCIAVLLAAGCGGGDEPPATPSEATGVIVQVERTGSTVHSFTLEAGGDRLAILIAPDVDYGFDLRHLEQHKATGDPVRCRLEQRRGRLYALSIEDA